VHGQIHCVQAVLGRFSVEEDDIILDESDEQANYQQLIRCFELFSKWEMIFQQCPKSKSANSIEFASWLNEIKEITTETFVSITDLVQTTTFGTPLEQFNDPREYEIIRGIYVPKLILWAHQINYETHIYFPEHLENCFELAELVANDSTVNIYKSFMVSGKMSVFLGAMKDAAMASLAFKKTPWTSIA
jgi:hypothetical protein